MKSQEDDVAFHNYLIRSSPGAVFRHCLRALLSSRIIIIIILESAVQGRERVRTLYQSKDPNPTQPTHGRKKKIKQ